MNALEVALALVKLHPADQGKVYELVGIINQDRIALSTLQKEIQDLTGDVRSEMSDNVIPIRPKKQGRVAVPNGPTAIVRELLSRDPHISYQDAQRHALNVNPSLNVKTFSATFYAERRKVA